MGRSLENILPDQDKWVLIGVMKETAELRRYGPDDLSAILNDTYEGVHPRDDEKMSLNVDEGYKIWYIESGDDEDIHKHLFVRVDTEDVLPNLSHIQTMLGWFDMEQDLGQAAEDLRTFSESEDWVHINEDTNEVQLYEGSGVAPEPSECEEFGYVRWSMDANGVLTVQPLDDGETYDIRVMIVPEDGGPGDDVTETDISYPTSFQVNGGPDPNDRYEIYVRIENGEGCAYCRSTTFSFAGFIDTQTLVAIDPEPEDGCAEVTICTAPLTTTAYGIVNGTAVNGVSHYIEIANLSGSGPWTADLIGSQLELEGHPDCGYRVDTASVSITAQGGNEYLIELTGIGLISPVLNPWVTVDVVSMSFIVDVSVWLGMPFNGSAFVTYVGPADSLETGA